MKDLYQEDAGRKQGAASKSIIYMVITIPDMGGCGVGRCGWAGSHLCTVQRAWWLWALAGFVSQSRTVHQQPSAQRLDGPFFLPWRFPQILHAFHLTADYSLIDSSDWKGAKRARRGRRSESTSPPPKPP